MNKLRTQYAKKSYYIRKRIEKLEENRGFVRSVERYKGEFLSLTDYKKVGKTYSDKELKFKLDRMDEILSSGELSLKENKRILASTIKTLNERGYDFINEDNIEETLDFLDDARARGLTAIYGYEAVVEAVNRAKQKGLSKEQILGNIDYWAEQDGTKALYVSKKRSSSRAIESSIKKRVNRRR